MRHILFLCGFIALFSISLFAQSKGEIRLSWSHPTDEFADVKRGRASEGGGFDLMLLSPMELHNLYFTLDAGFLLHGLNSQYRRLIRGDAESNDVKIIFSKYINVPIMVGLHYEVEMLPHNNLFGEVGFGFNTFKITDYTIGNDHSFTNVSYPKSFNFGYRYGLGILLNERYSLSLMYVSHGDQRFSGIITSDDAYVYRIRTINLSLGSRF